MNTKKIISILGGLSFVGLGVGYYLSKFYQCGNSSFCNFVYFRLGDSLFYGMGALTFIFLVLYFVPRAFNAWKWFAVWFIPLAAILFAITPEPQGFDLFTPDPETVFRWVSIVYVTISIIIIGWVTLFTKNK